MDRGAWQAIVPEVTKESNMTEHTHTYTVTVTGGFPGGTVVKNPSVSAGDKRGRLDPWVGKLRSHTS